VKSWKLLGKGEKKEKYEEDEVKVTWRAGELKRPWALLPEIFCSGRSSVRTTAFVLKT
jgi:hypothetical protein